MRFVLIVLCGAIGHAWSWVNVPLRSALAPRCALVLTAGADSAPNAEASWSAPSVELIVRDEMASLTRLEPEEQEAQLATFLQRVDDRAVQEAGDVSPVADADDDGYQFGDITKTVVEATRGEVQRQVSCRLVGTHT